MSKPRSTQSFSYTNPHPKGIRTDGDCVYRALAIATGKDWLTIYDELTALGRELLSPPNSSKTEQAYLDKIGKRIPAKYQTASGLKRHTPKSLPKSGTFVMSQANHLVTIKNGKARDTWDSSNRSAYIVWRVA